jgi:hypothetical protein
MKWGDRPLGDLPEKVLFRDSSGNWSGDSISKWSTDNGEGLVRDRRLLLDIGFFQENVWPNIDFGLTMRNLLGYVWSSENPDTSFSDRKITIEEGEIQPCTYLFLTRIKPEKQEDGQREIRGLR